MTPCLVRAWFRPAPGSYRPAPVPDRPGRAPSRPAPARGPAGPGPGAANPGPGPASPGPGPVAWSLAGRGRQSWPGARRPWPGGCQSWPGARPSRLGARPAEFGRGPAAGRRPRGTGHGPGAAWSAAAPARHRTGIRAVRRSAQAGPVAVPARCAPRAGLSSRDQAGGAVCPARRRVVTARGLTAARRPGERPARYPGRRARRDPPHHEPDDGALPRAAGEAALLRPEPGRGGAGGRAPCRVSRREVPVPVPAPHGCDRLRARGVPWGSTAPGSTRMRIFRPGTRCWRSPSSGRPMWR